MTDRRSAGAFRLAVPGLLSGKSAIALFAGALALANPQPAAGDPNSPPDMSVHFPKRVLAPGERAYFTVLIDARQFPRGIIGAYTEFYNHPPAITGPITWDIFSSGGDNWGRYIDGFLEGYPVNGSNGIFVHLFDVSTTLANPPGDLPPVYVPVAMRVGPRFRSSTGLFPWCSPVGD